MVTNLSLHKATLVLLYYWVARAIKCQSVTQPLGQTNASGSHWAKRQDNSPGYSSTQEQQASTQGIA